MTIYDQREQHVGYQYNAAGNINFGAVNNRVELVGELEKLQREMKQAADAGILDEETATDAEYNLVKAIQGARKPEPDRGAVAGYLETAKTLIEGVKEASGLVAALETAITLVQGLF